MVNINVTNNGDWEQKQERIERLVIEDVKDGGWN
jgi:hypothetical protein